MSDKPNVAKQYRVALLKAGLTHNGRERTRSSSNNSRRPRVSLTCTCGELKMYI